MALLAIAPQRAPAAPPVPPVPPASPARAPDAPPPAPSIDVLTPLQQRQMQQAVDRALRYLASRQATDGSFDTVDRCQPGVTGLCVLAFLSRGYLPNQGPYGPHIERGIEFILSCQREGGVLNGGDPEPIYISRGFGHCAMYNHGIAALTLCEAYGMADKARSEQIRTPIERARDFTLFRQAIPKRSAKDRGGWRYIVNPDPDESDLSISSWQLLFLRSARNAGFAVPASAIDAASAFVSRTFEPATGKFHYVVDSERSHSRGMTGAGILSLSLAGKHETTMARAGGDWLLAHPFARYKESISGRDRFFYGVFYATQGMFQLGGHYWKDFYPPLVTLLLDHQNFDGSWDAEPVDREVGKAYSTAMTVLALDTPHQLLPIFQR
jgi:hypothetical protein